MCLSTYILKHIVSLQIAFTLFLLYISVKEFLTLIFDFVVLAECELILLFMDSISEKLRSPVKLNKTN